MKQKTITTMEELIERLKNDDSARGETMKVFYERYIAKKRDDDYDFLYDMLSDLCAEHFIMEEECDTLIDSLDFYDRKGKVHRYGN